MESPVWDAMRGGEGTMVSCRASKYASRKLDKCCAAVPTPPLFCPSHFCTSTQALSVASCVAGAASLHQQALGLMHRLEPYADDALERARPYCEPALQRVARSFEGATSRLDAELGSYRPWQVVALTGLAVLVSMWVLARVFAAIADVREIGARPGDAGGMQAF